MSICPSSLKSILLFYAGAETFANCTRQSRSVFVSSHSRLGGYNLEFNPILVALMPFSSFFPPRTQFLDVVTNTGWEAAVGRGVSFDSGFQAIQAVMAGKHAKRSGRLWKMREGTREFSPLSLLIHSGTLVSSGANHVQHVSSFLHEITLEISSKHAPDMSLLGNSKS